MENEQKKNFFAARLIDWYRRHHRKLPWRESKDPYHIWISEVMLQQTRVETVIPYYHRFLEKFPTLEALAYAPEEEVLKAWEGLGYYSRARNLQAAVREVQERYGGTVPQEKEEISSLKGVGPYTTGAILSIAYNKPEPAVDGNVMRVLSRYFLIEDDIAKGSTRTRMEALAKELIPEGQAGDFNQALMELGATVCTPRSPHCLTCPVMDHCSARLEGMEEALPVKTKAKPPRPERRVVAFIRGAGERQGKFLIRQRPAEGLLARMWELPHYAAPAEAQPAPVAAARTGRARAAAPRAAASRGGARAGDLAPAEQRVSLAQAQEPPHAPGVPSRQHDALRAAEPPDQLGWPTAAAGQPQLHAPSRAASDHPHGSPHAMDGWLMRFLRERIADEEGLSVAPVGWLMDAEHTFSHIRWDMRVYDCRLDPALPQLDAALPSHYRWIGREDMEQYAFPNVFLRIIKEALRHNVAGDVSL